MCFQSPGQDGEISSHEGGPSCWGGATKGREADYINGKDMVKIQVLLQMDSPATKIHTAKGWREEGAKVMRTLPEDSSQQRRKRKQNSRRRKQTMEGWMGSNGARANTTKKQARGSMGGHRPATESKVQRDQCTKNSALCMEVTLGKHTFALRILMHTEQNRGPTSLGGSFFFGSAVLWKRR